VASAASAPHSNHAVVARPFGVTFPFSVALVAATEDAARVETAGGPPGVKLTIVPFDVPELLLAATRQ
jgi:hypothetical protein